MLGAAVLAGTGAANVVAVCALAPWLDESDPVAQLAGRTVHDIAYLGDVSLYRVRLDDGSIMTASPERVSATR